MQRIPVLCTLILGAFLASADATGWHTFKSVLGFSVKYPPTWVKFGTSANQLDIRSSPGGAEGMVIKRGQAYISVVAAPASEPMSSLIRRYTGDGTVEMSTRVSNVPGPCPRFTEIVVRDAAVLSADMPPGTTVPYFVHTIFFCEAPDSKAIVLLTNWEGDRRQRVYQGIALQIARTIRFRRP